ncbi:MAG: N-acetyl-1-D-myo-inositol-2-amino-2-deoxy-alpha-D-glucopyranoside deacetylase [bacterium]
MSARLPQRRLLLVHAHPDDETINNGATMARHAAEGAGVTLLTCTLGEHGEIIPPELAELEWDKGDQLGGYRVSELAAAMSALGVRDHRFLGGAGRFRDSGMIGTAANDGPRAFWRVARDPAVFAEAVGYAVDVVRDVRPQVVVTYDPNGGYGHPDHIAAHRVAMAGVESAADESLVTGRPAWAVSKVYWNVQPRSAAERGQVALAAAPEISFRVPAAEDLDDVVDDESVTAVVDGSEQLAAKTAALAAHATQVRVAGEFFALSNGLGFAIDAVECYRLVRGRAGAPFDAQGREQDLFGGLEVAPPSPAPGGGGGSPVQPPQ